MIVSWLSLLCFLVAAIAHFGFFIYEFFLLKGDPKVMVWARNLAIYNLCISLGTLFGLYMIFQKQIMLAGYVTSLFGLMMIAAALTLWFTAPRLRKWALLQGLPPLIGFVFLALHVFDRLGG